MPYLKAVHLIFECRSDAPVQRACIYSKHRECIRVQHSENILEKYNRQW